MTIEELLLLEKKLFHEWLKLFNARRQKGELIPSREEILASDAHNAVRKLTRFRQKGENSEEINNDETVNHSMVPDFHWNHVDCKLPSRMVNESVSDSAGPTD